MCVWYYNTECECACVGGVISLCVCGTECECACVGGVISVCVVPSVSARGCLFSHFHNRTLQHNAQHLGQPVSQTLLCFHVNVSCTMVFLLV